MAFVAETLSALRRVTDFGLGFAALPVATFFRATFDFVTLVLAARALTFLTAASFAGLDLERAVGRLAASFRAGVAFLLFFPGSARFM